MHSLRLKLILTFLIISVTGTLLTTMIVRFSNERALNEFLREQEQVNFVSDMLAYYERTGSWLGVVQTVETEPTLPGQPPNLPPPFALTNENGRVIIPNAQFQPGSMVSPDVLADGVPLQVDGVLVGMVLVDDQPAPRNPAVVAFEAQTNRALLFGALGGTAVAIILAIFMARTLTRPLQELAAASREMAQGNLQQEVPVRTQDELGELALAFNQMSADLVFANQSRRQMTAARRQMTADIAHDLRTPLTVLSGYLEAMEDGTLAPTPARLQMMQQEVDVLKRLVSDLRTLSLADAGQLTLHNEPVIIGDLLAQVQAAYVHQAEQQDVTIKWETGKSELAETAVSTPPIILDPARMRQALGNLVSNALRYTPPGGTITLAAAQPTNSCLKITVSDTGSGISEKDLPHIFDRFYRGDPSRQEGSGESGLGLAIVKSLVEAMDGKISVESAGMNRGTTFVITFPV